ncbi:MAG: NADH-quinone oxidoreductase subunit L [Nitrospira sp.]|nr:NADH-quinone oxidoreductase subunit L [Nitrospira sp.]
MLDLLWLVPTLPLLGFLALTVAGGWFSRKTIALIGVGSVGLSFAVAGFVGSAFIGLSGTPGRSYNQILWTWLHVSGFGPAIGFYLDPLSLVMMLVITLVGFLIHLYSAEFMIDHGKEPVSDGLGRAGEADSGYRRFFAYMNLFVVSMLTLVLADNLLLLYLGWEGVGLCSYLLIGFWYRDPANGAAAQKAFIVTRLGDVALAIGLFLLFTHLGTFNIQDLMARAAEQWPVGSSLAAIAAFLLLGGAVGKSAQLPLQTWLPDAMAGPTPVSALIHAATMVTAGMYLIARTHVLYSLAPTAQTAVAVIGALTLLLAACSALVQRDIKRVLAYSTISQIGYMFLALGVGAWGAALFHFTTHAFFKALLFLAAGAVIQSLHEEHDIYRMGGLRHRLPVTFWTFLIGAASLAGFPLVTAGFYSKDWILWEAWASPLGSPWLWSIGVIGAFLTALYSFRLVFNVFFGEAKTEVGSRPGSMVEGPLIVLAAGSLIAGFLEVPRVLGDVSLFSEFVSPALPSFETTASITTESALQVVTMLAALLGTVVAYVLFLRRPDLVTTVTGTAWGSTLSRFWIEGWGFDRLYDTWFVRPFLWVAQANKDDLIDRVYGGLAWLIRQFFAALHRTQTGQVRWYAAVLAAGSVVIVALMVLS